MKNYNYKRHNYIKIYIKINSYNYKVERPFINIPRFYFLKFCEFWNLPIYIDSTNYTSEFRRNRLRLQLIPYLKNFFNINLINIINQTQKIINLENDYFFLIIKKLFFIKETKLKNNIQYNFIYFPKIIQYRLIHNFYYLIKKNISFIEISKILKKFKLKNKY